MYNTDSLLPYYDNAILKKLTKLKDPLVKLEEHIDWSMFLPILDEVYNRPKKAMLVVLDTIRS